jgi:predicted dipeptidase
VRSLTLLAVLLCGCSPTLWGRYQRDFARRLVPLLREVLRFPTYEGNPRAHADQKAWLARACRELGFEFRDSGPVVEVELPGPPGAPVLGLVVHGDVVKVDAGAWSVPPFDGVVQGGEIVGRGAADDKGPLVQALLAMKVLAESGMRRTHTIRLLVGSDEESGSTDMGAYLKLRRPPDYSLVLDSDFPVVVGELAWNALRVTAPPDGPAAGLAMSFEYQPVRLDAGMSASIVPDRAEVVLAWSAGTPRWDPVAARLRAKPLRPGTRLELWRRGDLLSVVVRGRAAHAGANLAGGRNALVALARLLEGELPPSGIADLLGFARLAGADLFGKSLGLTRVAPGWGSYLVNVATVKPAKEGGLTLTINVRRPPPLTAPELRAHLERIVREFNARAGAHLRTSGYWADEPTVFDPDAKLVRRLLAAYRRATGEAARPAISGGGTYAKRLPNAIAFGMWFPARPYPGHDVDERVPIADLHRGVAVLLEALADIACGPRLDGPLRP